MRFLYRFFFKLFGWKIIGHFPSTINKLIIIVAPHSSNWDFLIGLAVRSIVGFKANFLAKKELFIPPFGWLFRKLGGRPVDRSKSAHLVDEVAAIFQIEKKFILAIAPEGTRKAVKQWRTGFYHIACKAQVPILMAAIDYPSKTVTWSDPLYPGGNLIEDARTMESFFRNKQGKNRGITSIV